MEREKGMEIAVDTWVNYSRLFSIRMVLLGRSEPLMGSIGRGSRPLRGLATWSVPARSRCGVDWSRIPNKRRRRKCPPHVPITCVGWDFDFFGSRALEFLFGGPRTGTAWMNPHLSSVDFAKIGRQFLIWLSHLMD